MSAILDNLVSVFAAIVVVATLLPMTSSKRWWIRGLDFPRLQIMFVAVVLIVPAYFWSERYTAFVFIALGAVIIYQSLRILPFTPLWPKEVILTDPNAPSAVTAMSSNVEMTNDRFDLVAGEIDETDPDILFLMETNQNWADQLAPKIARYSTVKNELRENYYGMIFATRLKVRRVEFDYLTHDDTPTLFAELEDKQGNVFRFIGLHPRPPLPGDDTQERDAHILYAAKIARETDLPVVIMGDFNDAAWSDTSRRFKRMGEYLDPRIGRGIFPSFDANSWLVRAPIDQLYISASVALVRFWRGAHVGSDHFPIHARFVPDRKIGIPLNRPPKEAKPRDEHELKHIRPKFRDQLGTENIK